MKKVLLRYTTCVILRLQRQLALSRTLLVVQYSRQRPLWVFFKKHPPGEEPPTSETTADNHRRDQLIFSCVIRNYSLLLSLL